MKQMSMFEDFNVFSEVTQVQATPVTIEQIREACGRRWYVDIRDNFYHGRNDGYETWAVILECGKSYMVGQSIPMHQFLKTHRSSLTTWQKLAYQWARAHPEKKLVLYNYRRTREWEVYTRGEYVEMGLPHHDAGGERHYVTRDGKTKIHVNED